MSRRFPKIISLDAEQITSSEVSNISYECEYLNVICKVNAENGNSGISYQVVGVRGGIEFELGNIEDVEAVPSLRAKAQQFNINGGLVEQVYLVRTSDVGDSTQVDDEAILSFS